MTQFITADTIICESPPGTCIYTLVQMPPDPEETAFLIREQSGIIADLGKHPPIQVRAGLFTQNGVTLLPILISISAELYEAWLNYHAEEYAQPALAALYIQDRLSFHFYDDRRRRIRSLITPNPHQAFWRTAVGELAPTAPWTPEDFETAREILYAKYPTMGNLWNALQSPTAPSA
jgi:hypothetical protein